ncbi:diguanylate cyclase [Demequina sp. NBRC 110057]|uniref:sensor domain-containing diguanylate cyclase n=1 Tax=Demequina sp. NBRC 110057 TaxID=1570346 RepID=UPI000A052E5C|nr:diguanylate cyclase [Demequina sp. NBRC 110057]
MFSRKLPTRSRGYFIAIGVVVGIVLLQAGATIAGVVLASRQLDAAALDTYGYVGDLTEERVARYAESARDVVVGTAQQLSRTDEVTREDLTASVQERLKREPTVRAVYIGWPDGAYLVLRRVGTGFAQYTGAADGTVTADLLDTTFEPVADTDPLEDYDPRVRPWYVAGSSESGTVWTDPYLEFDTSNTLESVAQAATVHGRETAVVGADLNLDMLGGVLDDLPYGDGAEAFILTPTEQVIAAPTSYADELRAIAAAADRVPTASDLGLEHSDPPTRADATEFTRSGSVILLDRTFPGEEKLDWVIHITADESQLSSGLGDLGRTLGWVTGASLLIVIGAVVFALRLRHPLKRMRERATMDPLTGLANRPELMRRGGRLVAGARSRGDRMMVTMLDLDGFKGINDEYGHDAGDRVLIGVAMALRSAVREGDVVARLGGDEFVTVQVLRRRADAVTVAERVRSDVERELQTRIDVAGSVGLTMGVAEAIDGETDLRALLTRADTALIRGKQMGKGEVYDGNSCPSEDVPAHD